jgi:transaldolase
VKYNFATVESGAAVGRTVEIINGKGMDEKNISRNLLCHWYFLIFAKTIEHDFLPGRLLVDGLVGEDHAQLLFNILIKVVMEKIHNLYTIGQSVWLDYIQRSLLVNGELQKLIDEGVKGITTNPTIFENAIAGTGDYDADIAKSTSGSTGVAEIYEMLIFQDIRMAAELLMPVYRESQKRDGYVSIEVSPELAFDAEDTVRAGVRIFAELNMSNIMIKVPATEQGVRAMTELISQGINVNATLIFSLENYRKVANGYLDGLEKYLENNRGADPGHIASVASFFISRIDSAVDRQLSDRSQRHLHGKAAVANAKIAYQEYKNIFSGPRWEKLKKAGATTQRPLWASTGVKNTAYKSTLYVDELIGAETVNTVPLQTYTAFKQYGTVAETIANDLEEAKENLANIGRAGIDFDEITRQLQEGGLKAFSKSYRSLLDSIGKKADSLK